MSIPEAGTAPEASALKVRVLLVDDQLIIVEAIRRLLAGQADIEFHYVTDATYAEVSAERIAPSVILQDLVLPDIDGFSLIKYYRGNDKLRDVPVVVLSAKEDPKLKAQGFAAGANDYMVKLPDQQELLTRLRYHSDAYHCRGQLRACRQQLAETERALAELRAATSKN
jgi:two-component system chemotaxis family response regulator WspR